MELNEQTLRVIRSTSGVAKFLGRDKKPVAVPEKEVKRMLDYLSDISMLNTSSGSELSYLPGDIVEIKRSV